MRSRRGHPDAEWAMERAMRSRRRHPDAERAMSVPPAQSPR